MQSAQRTAQGRSNSRLNKETLRVELLRLLPQLAYNLAAQRDSPARVTSEALLAELLEAITSTLHNHLPPELKAAARTQLAALCRRAQAITQTLESCVRDSSELIVSKVNIGFLGASTDEIDRQVLDNVRVVSSHGGIVRKLSTEALWLSMMIERVVDRRDLNFKEAPNGTALPAISEETFIRLAEQARQIVRARNELSEYQTLSFPRKSIGVRNPHRDRQRELVLVAVESAATIQEKISNLKHLRRDAHPDARRVLLSHAQNVSVDLEIREVCCCLLEEIAADISIVEGNEIARHLLVRLTQHLVSRKFAVPDLSILLRLLTKFGRLDSSAVITQLLEDSQLKESTKGSDHEIAVLLLVLALLGRGGTATRCLESMVLGVGLEHLEKGPACLVRRGAVTALAGQEGGTPKLIQLLEFYQHATESDEVAIKVAECLSNDDDSKKVEQLVEILGESSTTKSPPPLPHILRVVRALQNTRNPRAFTALVNVILNGNAPMLIRQECANSLLNVRGEAALRLSTAFEKAIGLERLLLMKALRGAPDDLRYDIFFDAISTPIKYGDGNLAVREKLDALNLIREWKVV